MRRAATWLLSAAILALLAAACGAVVDGQATPTPVTSTPTQAVLLPAVPPVASPSPSAENAEQQAAVDAALRDAAGRLSMATGAGDLHVQQVEPRQWPDSSLGCPSQGLMYSQIVTPGYLIVISAAGKQLEYHADSRGRVVFCQEL